MDSIKGAIILRNRLLGEPEQKGMSSSRPIEVPNSAPPLFHWLQVEPEEHPDDLSNGPQ